MCLLIKIIKLDKNKKVKLANKIQTYLKTAKLNKEDKVLNLKAIMEPKNQMTGKNQKSRKK